MTVTLPIPNGKADWTNYTDYWREEDAEWIQERTVLRYTDATERAVDWDGTNLGQVTYNETAARLQLAAGLDTWATIQSYVNLTSTQDDASGVAISHKDAGGKGIVFHPGGVTIDEVFMAGGVLTADSSGVTIEAGGKPVKITTDATHIVFDSPISAPEIKVDNISAGSITIPPGGSLTVENITLSNTLSGGVINGSSGTIGGVTLAGGIATAPGGFISNAGIFYGDSNSAILRQRNPANGALGAAYFQAQATDLIINATNTYNYGYMRIMGGRGMPWHNAAGGHQAWISPSFYAASDPGAANFPDGTLWIQ